MTMSLPSAGKTTNSAAASVDSPPKRLTMLCMCGPLGYMQLGYMERRTVVPITVWPYDNFDVLIEFH